VFCFTLLVVLHIGIVVHVGVAISLVLLLALVLFFFTLFYFCFSLHRVDVFFACYCCSLCISDVIFFKLLFNSLHVGNWYVILLKLLCCSFHVVMLLFFFTLLHYSSPLAIP